MHAAQAPHLRSYTRVTGLTTEGDQLLDVDVDSGPGVGGRAVSRRLDHRHALVGQARVSGGRHEPRSPDSDHEQPAEGVQPGQKRPGTGRGRRKFGHQLRPGAVDHGGMLGVVACPTPPVCWHRLPMRSRRHDPESAR